MKKFDRLKTIQLVLFILMTVACGLVIFMNKELYHIIGINPAVRILGILLWVTLGLSFLFIFLDYNSINEFKEDFRELDFAVHSDPVAGIANRYSSDMLIEKYLDKPLPEGLGCIMLELSNLGAINNAMGHTKGNETIRNFSSFLKSATSNKGHIGRNGGNKFLALFENCSDETINDFLIKLNRKVRNNNTKNGSLPIEYKYGVAFNEGESVSTITDLIALANKRIYENR